MSAYLIRMVGGPHPGDRQHSGPWPLPDRFEDENGYYRKIAQSILPEDVPGVMRGAQYEWVAETEPKP